MAERPAPAWRVALDVPPDVVDAVESALGQLGGAIVTEAPGAQARVSLEAFLTEEPARARVTALLAAAALAAGTEVPDFSIERLPERDWLAESRKALPPIEAGPFYVYGAHVAEPPPSGSIALRVEASMAFGTGRHESTRGCLLALAGLGAERGVGRALDMGCGSGILALAIAKLGACPVTAVDNDPAAVRMTAETARINNAAALVHAHRGDGYGCRAVAEAAPYDLIVSNILAGPLCAMAPGLVRHLAPGGTAVLSGLLADQEERVLARHEPLRLVRRIALGDWVTLVLESP